MKRKKIFKVCLVSLFLICVITSSLFTDFNISYVYAIEQEENWLFNKTDINNSIEDNITLINSTGKSGEVTLITGDNNENFSTERSPNDLTDVKYISNANYFLINPQHHENYTNNTDNIAGTCTTVAVQMLLGYHNYYSDRRIIPASSNDKTFLAVEYGDITLDPFFKREREPGQGCNIIGTQDDVYQEIFDNTFMAAVPGLGQAIGLVKEGALDFINTYTAEAARSGISITSGLFSATEARSDIDAGRPIVLGMDLLLEGNMHVVPAYGYAKLGDVDGFLVHYGWGDSGTQVWVPESFFGFQIRMNVTHSHNLTDTGNIVNDFYRELSCNDCGYKTVDSLYNTVDSTITGVNYPLTSAYLPRTIDVYSESTASFTTHTINSIGSNAFANQTQLTSVTIPYSITNIGTHAFAGCTNLENINIQTPTIIENGAFVGCNNLTFTVYSNNPNYSTQNNILYDKNKTKIIATGDIAASIEIPDTITEISPYAFAENANLVSVRFSGTPAIGAYAFNKCPNLNAVYFDSYDVPTTVGENSFSNNTFVLYTRYNVQNAYSNIFATYTNNIVSIPLTITFMSDGQVLERQVVYNGSTISTLPNPTRTGYTFGGWYTNEDYTGTPYQNGGLWEAENDFTLYAKWTPNQYTVTLDANGGTLDGANTFVVNYGETYQTESTTTRTGYTFEGWYDSNNVQYITKNGIGTVLWNKTENTTLYAHWAIESYEIRINADGTIVWLGASGNLSDTSCKIEYGTILSTINLISTFKNSEYGFKEGYIFDHFESNDSNIEWSNIPDLGEDGAIITITPVWVLEEHTIYLNTGRENVVTIAVAKYNEPINLPQLNDIGWIFNGWYKDLEDEECILWQTMPDLTPNTQSNGSIMLYAKWTQITYTVVYDKNGGAGVMESSTHTYGVEQELTSNAYTRTNYAFMGWATSPTGQVVYEDCAKVINLTTVNGSNFTLYAVWREIFEIEYKNLTSDMVLYPSLPTYTHEIGLSELPTIYLSGSSATVELENFYGWYTDSNFTKKVTSISKTQTGKVTLYAKYDYWISTTYASTTKTVTDSGMNNQPSFSVDVFLGSVYFDIIKNTTLDTIKIEISFDMWEVNDGYQDLYLYNGNTQLWSTTINRGSGTNSTPEAKTFVIVLDLSSYKNVDSMDLKFSAHGNFEDTWKFNNFVMSITFTN